MKALAISTASAVAVASAFMLIGRADLEWGQQLVALWAALGLLNVLYIPRWPKAAALRQALRLKRGQKIEVEGK